VDGTDAVIAGAAVLRTARAQSHIADIAGQACSTRNGGDVMKIRSVVASASWNAIEEWTPHIVADGKVADVLMRWPSRAVERVWPGVGRVHFARHVARRVRDMGDGVGIRGYACVRRPWQGRDFCSAGREQ
jgi:hypothetical protein